MISKNPSFFSFFSLFALILGIQQVQVQAQTTGSLKQSYESTNTKKIEYLTGQYSITFKNATFSDALRFLAKASGVNLVIPDGITAPNVSLDLNNMDLLDAINVLLKTNGLGYAVEGNILRVGKASEFKNNEEILTSTVRLKYAKASELHASVKSLLTESGKIIFDARTNTLTFKDIKSNVSVIKQMLQVIDIQDTQVLIQAKIVQVNTDFLRDLGVTWNIGNSGSGRRIEGTGTVTLPATNPTSSLGVLFGTFGNINVDVALSAAEERGDLRIVSKPSIITSNGKEAKIRSGETLLIKTLGSTAGESGELKEVETGVELNVTPQISIDRQIKLDINAVTSLADFSRQIDGVPIIVDNEAVTSVLVRDGQTTVIGGLLQFQKQRGRKGVPLLSRIPLFGALFRSKFKQNKNVELMIFIKPVIVNRTPVKLGYPYPEDPEIAAEPKKWPSISMVDEADHKKEKRRIKNLKNKKSGKKRKTLYNKHSRSQ